MNCDDLKCVSKPVRVLLSIGSNMGNREKFIHDALKKLVENRVLYNIKSSSVYETEPVGYKEQPWFLNIVVYGMTLFPVKELMDLCQNIENEIGRVARSKWHEREIDIDILLYGRSKVSESGITIPHPRMHERKFVLVPAAEIAGSEIHPGFGASVKKLLSDCNDNSKVNICH